MMGYNTYGAAMMVFYCTYMSPLMDTVYCTLHILYEQYASFQARQGLSI